MNESTFKRAISATIREAHPRAVVWAVSDRFHAGRPDLIAFVPFVGGPDVYASDRLHFVPFVGGPDVYALELKWLPSPVARRLDVARLVTPIQLAALAALAAAGVTAGALIGEPTGAWWVRADGVTQCVIEPGVSGGALRIERVRGAGWLLDLAALR